MVTAADIEARYRAATWVAVWAAIGIVHALASDARLP